MKIEKGNWEGRCLGWGGGMRVVGGIDLIERIDLIDTIEGMRKIEN